MKARPMLMSAPMVRSSWNGSKVQTRRTRGLEFYSRLENEPDRWWCSRVRDGVAFFVFDKCPNERQVRCPYGKPGDLLWVRETFREHDSPDQDGSTIEYRADRPEFVKADDDPSAIAWRPSIHMPRSVSRLTLRISDIRVERLQDISEQDAIAEGVEFETADPPFYYVPGIWPHSLTAVEIEDGAVRSYAKLWVHINGTGSWEANPWVWALTFDAIKANVDDVLQREAA